MIYNSKPIVKVYDVYSNFDSEDEMNYDQKTSVLIPCPEIVLHISKGKYLGFETEDCFITVGTDGIKTYNSKETVSDLGMYIDEYESYVSWETTLFSEERFVSCDFKQGCEKYVVKFTDFIMQVFCYDEKFEAPEYDSTGVPIKAASHLIKRRCVCGEIPNIMLDFVDDFYVKCSKCGAETWHTFELKTVIDDWHNQDLISVSI